MASDSESVILPSSASLQPPFPTEGSITQRLRGFAQATDDALRMLWRQLAAPAGLALIAVGGYGRGVLFPFSDLDLLLLRTPDCAAEDFVSQFLTSLWDRGQQVGAALRTVTETLEAARGDLSIATTLLELRFLAGDAGLWQDLRRQLRNNPPWSINAFFAAKVAEQEARHRRFRDTAYHLEPQTKDGPGGLRDVHQLLWFAGRIWQRPELAVFKRVDILDAADLRQLRAAERFIAQVRVAMHLRSGRAEDRLRLELQEAIANDLGFTAKRGRSAAERLMQRLYQSFAEIQALTAIVEEAIAHYLATGQFLDSSFDAEEHPSALLRHWGQRASVAADLPAQMLRAARRQQKDWKPQLFSDPAFRAAFLQAIVEPLRASRVLNWLHRTGLLGRILPAFQRISGLIQRDLFHAYTVDQHTLFLVDQLAELWRDTDTRVLRTAWREIDQPAYLILAGLFHDIGKGRGGDHSRIGAREWRTFARRLQLPESERAVVAWLIEEHLLMSSTSQRRDLDDPEIIRQFALWAGTRKRLAHLFLLTVADMRATNPDLWNDWKASLLYKLYERADAFLASGTAADDRREIARQRIEALAGNFSDLQSVELQRLWRALPVGYFLRYDSEELLWQARQILQRKEDYRVAIRHHRHQGEQIFLFGPDRPGLFQNIAAVLDRHSLAVLDARIDTSDNGLALDTFHVVDETRAFQRSAAAHDELATELRNMLNLGVHSEPHFGLRHRDARHRFFAGIPLQLHLDNDALPDDTLLEVQACDQMGLLYSVGAVIAELGFSVVAAKVSTFGERVEDTFFIRNERGEKLRRRERQLLLTTLEQRLNDKFPSERAKVH
ncbi:HD domain-containing protein [Acidithiobacillus sp. AMEEHan]|uniref:bifunctional uridylyltransferase/uridylyl-removing protein GlnD n=1 Tax=Acidithiobacillus sp. AMEEHan TaxID=2994951 RepID=UPI0027E41560|nr:HD domain-containing protein [Acidithiobacillus sp. AMEEHan]